MLELVEKAALNARYTITMNASLDQDYIGVNIKTMQN